MSARVTLDDLRLAHDWMGAYEFGEGPDGGPVATLDPEVIADLPEGDRKQAESLLRTRAWLEAEIARREEDATIRQIARMAAERYGRTVTETEARAAYRKHLAASA